MTAKNPFGAEASLKTRGGQYTIYRLPKLIEERIGDVETLPFSIRVLLESCLRNVDNFIVNESDVVDLANWNASRPSRLNSPSSRDASSCKILPAFPRSSIWPRCAAPWCGWGAIRKRSIRSFRATWSSTTRCRSMQFATPLSLQFNVDHEFERNIERYQFLRWGQQAFNNFRVVPPATGIVHQVNLEYLAKVVLTRDGVAFPGQPGRHRQPHHDDQRPGRRRLGRRRDRGRSGDARPADLHAHAGSRRLQICAASCRKVSTATDLVLTVTQMLRKHGVVSKFVEFYGPGLDAMTLPDRATLANMAPEYGATMGFFPVDTKRCDT